MIRASESTNTTTVAPSTETVGGIAPETGSSSISSETEVKGREEKSAPYNTKAIRLEL